MPEPASAIGVYARVVVLLLMLFVVVFAGASQDLPWWCVGIGMGLVGFAFISSIPGVAWTFTAGWLALVLGAIVLASAWLVARFHDISLDDLATAGYVYRKSRHLPANGIALLTFSAVAFAAAFLRRRRKPKPRRVRKARNNGDRGD